MTDTLTMFLVTYTNPFAGINKQVLCVCETELKAFKEVLVHLAGRTVSSYRNERSLFVQLNECSEVQYEIRSVTVK